MGQHFHTKNNMGIGSSCTSYTVCEGDDEDLEHCFFKCHWTRPVWFGGLLQINISGSATNSFTRWFENKIQELSHLGERTEAAIDYVGYTLWEIWKMRNEQCFRGHKPNPFTCIKKINLAHAETTKSGNATHVARGNGLRIKRKHTWRKPPRGYVKCNTDAAMNLQNNRAMGSCLIRDEKGDVNFGSTKLYYTSKPLLAEALALREAALSAANMNWTNILFESDNQQLIEACLRRKQVGLIKNIVQDILAWKEYFPNWGFTWTGRDGNVSAHTIAHLALHGNLPSQWLWNPPPDLRRALVKDKQDSQGYLTRHDPPGNLSNSWNGNSFAFQPP